MKPSFRLAAIGLALSALIRPLPAGTYGEPEPVFGVPEAHDIAAVQDKAGRIHVLATRSASGSDVLTYHYYDGETWAAAQPVRNAQLIQSLDLEFDELGDLHACVLEKDRVTYLSASPGGLWTTNLVALGGVLDQRGSGASIDISTASDGTIVRHIAFSGGAPDPGLRYATSSTGTSWTLETVDSIPASGLAPSISAGRWPLAGQIVPPGSPVIAYVDGGTGEVLVSYRTRPFFGGDPFWTTPAVIAHDGSGEQGLGPKLEIRDGVAHLVCRGRSELTEPVRPLYFSRFLQFDLFSGNQAVERIEEILPSSRVEELELVLGSGGRPGVLWLRNELGDPWKVQVFERGNPGNWTGKTILVPETLQAIGPMMSGELLFGPLGRKTAILGRQEEFDTVAIREEGAANTSFAVQVPARVDPGVTPAVVPDGRGGGLVGLIDASGDPLVRRYDPDGGLVDELRPDDGRGTAIRSQVQMERLGSGRVVFAYVTSVQVDTFQYRRYVEVFLLDETSVAHHFEIGANGGIFPPRPEIDLAVDGSTGWLVVSQPSSFFGRIETRLYVFDQSGTRATDVETKFGASVPPYLKEPALDVRNGHVVIVGAVGNSLRASVFDPGDGVWVHGEAIRSFASEDELPVSRDVVIRSTSVAATLAAVAFAEGNQLMLAYRLSNTNWSTRPIADLPDLNDGETQTAFVRLDNPGPLNRFHLAWLPLKGGEANGAFHARFIDPDNNPVDPVTFLEPIPLEFEAVHSIDFAVDRFGLESFVAFDEATRPSAPRVLFPTWSRDDDRDGVPLFLERAFGRDPDVPEFSPVFYGTFSTQPVIGSIDALLSFDRPAGPALRPNESVIEAGSFRYSLEVGSNLRSFVRATDSGLLQSVDPLPPRAGSAVGVAEERTRISRSLGGLPKGFFRLDVSVRR